MDSASEIDKITWRVLRDAGQDYPPVQVAPIYTHLKLHRTYYNLRDPGFLDRAKYALRVGSETLVDLVNKAKLQAALFFDERRVVIDNNLPEIKREWPACHEATHDALPWHRTYFLGDTAQTLDPDWQEMLEAEANYGASALLLCGPIFDRDAKDVRPEWAEFDKLRKRFGKSIPITGRRYLLRGPDHPMALLVSTPAWKQIPEDQTDRCRHFVRSPSFDRRFSQVTVREIMTHLHLNVRRRAGGILADYGFQLDDDNGQSHEFRAQCFFNTYYLVTLIVHQRPVSHGKIIVPRSIRFPAC